MNFESADPHYSAGGFALIWHRAAVFQPIVFMHLIRIMGLVYRYLFQCFVHVGNLLFCLAAGFWSNTPWWPVIMNAPMIRTSCETSHYARAMKVRRRRWSSEALHRRWRTNLQSSFMTAELEPRGEVSHSLEITTQLHTRIGMSCNPSRMSTHEIYLGFTLRCHPWSAKVAVCWCWFRVPKLLQWIILCCLCDGHAY